MTSHRTRSERLARFNLTMTIIWVGLLVPSLLWWKNSLVWIVLMSAYANIVGHWSAYQGSRASVKVEQNGNGGDPSAASVSSTSGG